MSAQSISQVANFENQLPQADTAWFGQDQVTDGDTVFTSGSFTFENNYNASWGIFSGWCYSNTTDVNTPGFLNQYSNITGSGESSNQFGICYASSFSNNRLFLTSGTLFNPTGAYFTNSTYSYLSMLDGDTYGKQFGSNVDANGTLDNTDGEDWFLLTIYGLNADSTMTGDSVNFYLADYRFTDDNDDYLVNTWEWVDLSSLGMVFGLDFKLSSSDAGTSGMNTPAYFSMDNLSGQYLSLKETTSIDYNLYPNPANEMVMIETPLNSTIQITDISGRVIYNNTAVSDLTQIYLTNFMSGIYIVNITNNGISTSQKLIKK